MYRPCCGWLFHVRPGFRVLLIPLPAPPHSSCTTYSYRRAPVFQAARKKAMGAAPTDKAAPIAYFTLLQRS
jgi:hypothetical protein